MPWSAKESLVVCFSVVPSLFYRGLRATKIKQKMSGERERKRREKDRERGEGKRDRVKETAVDDRVGQKETSVAKKPRAKFRMG